MEYKITSNFSRCSITIKSRKFLRIIKGTIGNHSTDFDCEFVLVWRKGSERSELQKLERCCLLQQIWRQPLNSKLSQEVSLTATDNVIGTSSGVNLQHSLFNRSKKVLFNLTEYVPTFYFVSLTDGVCCSVYLRCFYFKWQEVKCFQVGM